MSNARDRLLQSTGRRYKTVETKIGPFTLRSLTEYERSEYELTYLDAKTATVDIRKLPEAKLRLVGLTLVDENEQLMFNDNQWRELESVDSAVIAELYSAALRHIGFEDAEAEELVKNSD